MKLFKTNEEKLAEVDAEIDTLADLMSKLERFPANYPERLIKARKKRALLKSRMPPERA